ncbi:monovalent cation/H(+) antiporter subunit G [Roseiflexus sp.]|uniref:monovalent cation/H(+) antiporter subunit G n=1 Tax=Roseiflexus sp. TaxID=2562120 RepID=UPI0021DB9BC3|nr:monovalent cation/H(+) antiporter subunit G [Roseiflexus sp.]GIW00762.1 MAG: Na+/H+ antiporter subunit G [Roseiflexus sp.]
MIGMIQEIVSAVLLVIGTLLLLLAGIGIVRMPDIFLRMSAASKASSLGAGCVLLAVAVSAADIAITVRAVAGVLFLFLTAPVASHMIGRAAYMIGVPLWKGTLVDELKGHYDTRRHTLRGVDDASPRPQRGTGPLGDVRDAGR